MDTKEHWEQVYSKTDPDALSWFQLHADQSLRLIRDTRVPGSASIIDIGGGASMLVDDLLAHGYSHLSVLDRSAAAMASARQRLGPLAQAVGWIEGDITAVQLPFQGYDLWHDRAVFHFLNAAASRRRRAPHARRRHPEVHLLLLPQGRAVTGIALDRA